jgi:RHS repeat-associated protein
MSDFPLTEVTQGGTLIATYTYNALTQRIGIQEGGSRIWSVYNGKGPDALPYADFNGSGALLTRYVSGPGMVNGAVTQILLARTSSGGATAWYLTDKLDSVRDIVSSSGSVLDNIVYDSFGNVLTETNASNADRFKFAGMQYDSTTQQYFDQARWYGPAQGRFLSQDPVAFGGGDYDLYRYVNNEVTTFVDRSGLDASASVSAALQIGAKIAAAATAAGADLVSVFVTNVTAPALQIGARIAAAAAASTGVTVAGVAAAGMVAMHAGVALAAAYAVYATGELAYWLYAWGAAAMAGGVLDAQIAEAQGRLMMLELARQVAAVNAIGVNLAKDFDPQAVSDLIDDLKFWKTVDPNQPTMPGGEPRPPYMNDEWLAAHIALLMQALAKLGVHNPFDN